MKKKGSGGVDSETSCSSSFSASMSPLHPSCCVSLKVEKTKMNKLNFGSLIKKLSFGVYGEECMKSCDFELPINVNVISAYSFTTVSL